MAAITVDSAMQTALSTVIGWLLLDFDESGNLTALTFPTGDQPPLTNPEADNYLPFRRLEQQLGEYFTGSRTSFDVPIQPHGTPFQMQVWKSLLEIPYGTTVSYAELTRMCYLPPTAIRAVGRANATNPVSIIIPCHRVIGSDGSLTGYAGGLERKRRLLEIEGVLLKL